MWLGAHDLFYDGIFVNFQGKINQEQLDCLYLDFIFENDIMFIRLQDEVGGQRNSTGPIV